jgi:DNA-binding transcriptional MerR regulator
MLLSEPLCLQGLPPLKFRRNDKLQHQTDVPRRKPDKLVAKAIRLLGEGKPQNEVAKKCGISVRTLQRWVASEGIGENQADQLVIAAYQAVQLALASASAQEQLNDLLDYRNSQKYLALEMGSLATRLSKLSKEAIQRLESRPDVVRHLDCSHSS